MRVADLTRWLMMALVAFGLAACAGSRGGPIAYDNPSFRAPDAPQPTTADSRGAIAVGDTLAVNVLEANDLSRDYTVEQSGNITMPLIGNVKAVGLTPPALATSISQRLNERYMRNPNVTVSLKASASRTVTVDGSVRNPGVFPINGDLTLIQAVALARGTDEGANPRRVAIFRRIDGQRMAAAFDLVQIRRGESQDPTVYPGDVVVVDGNRTGATVKSILGNLPLLALFRPF